MEDAFQKLTGRAPTSTELAALYRTQAALGLRDDDPMWIILVALQHYERLYAEIPEHIDQVSHRIRLQADRLEGLTARLEHADILPSSSPLPHWTRSRRTRIGGGILAAILLFGGAVLALSSGPHGSAAEAVVALDAANDLPTCFHGTGRIEMKGDRKYCFPVTSDGRVLGFAIGGR